MNYSIIVYIIGMILKIEAVFMALPAITALIYQGFLSPGKSRQERLSTQKKVS